MHIQRGDILTAVTLGEIKIVGVIEHDFDDTKLALLAASVTAEYCNRLNTALLLEPVTVTYDTWSCGTPLRLPIAPLTQANAATLAVVQDVDGAPQTIAPTALTIRSGHRPTLAVNASSNGPLTVSYTAGLPTVPDHIRAALAMQVVHLHDLDLSEATQRRLSPAYASALHQRQRVTI